MAEKTLRGAFPLSTRKISARIGIAPIIAAVVLLIIILIAIFAPLVAPHDPLLQNPIERLKPPSSDHLLGTDNYGRDLFSRVVYGARVSLVIGIGVTILSVVIGLAVGLVSGFFRTADAVIMRIMDGLMAMPSVLLAIAIVSLVGASIWTVMAAITIPEIPRVVRLVRSVVLTAREEPYVEAAIALGTSMPRVLWRHLMPNTFAPLTRSSCGRASRCRSASCRSTCWATPHATCSTRAWARGRTDHARTHGRRPARRRGLQG